MARTKNKMNMWLLAAAALVAPAIMSARTQAQPAPTAAVEEVEANADIDGGPEGACPFYCNSSAQCTTGCHTEALCQQHRCFPL